jgi:hypothetical protein
MYGNYAKFVFKNISSKNKSHIFLKFGHGRDRNVGGFSTTCEISAYYHLPGSCKFESHSWCQWGVLDTTLCDKVCQWLVAGQWFCPGPPVSSTNKTDCHDITEILLKVELNTKIHPLNNDIGKYFSKCSHKIMEMMQMQNCSLIIFPAKIKISWRFKKFGRVVKKEKKHTQSAIRRLSELFTNFF